MAAPKQEPHDDTNQHYAPEDTFLFMGKRIPLDSAVAASKSAAERRRGADSMSAESSIRTANPNIETQSVEGQADKPYEFQSFAAASKPSGSGRIFLVGAGLLVVVVSLLVVWHYFGSLEARILRAANSGRLVQPQGSSAYDLYLQLKAKGLGPVAKQTIKDKVLNQILNEGERRLQRVYGGFDLKQEELDPVARLYEWAYDLNPMDSPIVSRLTYTMGYRALLRGSLPEAEKAFTAAMRSDSQWALPFINLAHLNLKEGRPEAAEYYYQQANALDSKWPLPRMELGQFYEQQGRLAEAELSYRAAGDVDPTQAAPWYHLGRTYQKEKKKVEALAAYERALELAEKSPSTAFSIDELRTQVAELKK